MSPVLKAAARRLLRGWFGPLSLAALLACCAFSAQAPGEPPPCPVGNCDAPPSAPRVEEKQQHTAKGGEVVPAPAFVDGLTVMDEAFEVRLGQGRILALKESLVGKPPALIAVGDPTVIDFVVVSPRQIRVTGKRLGVTDLSITTPDERTYTFEVRVTADLDVLHGQLRCLFPDASLKLTQVQDHLVVEGEARDAAQTAHILETIRHYLESVYGTQVINSANQSANADRGGIELPPGVPPAGAKPPVGQVPPPNGGGAADVQPLPPTITPPSPTIPGAGVTQLNSYSPAVSGAVAARITVVKPEIVNLIRVPGSQQVLLKVRVAELNRTALRQIGADWVKVNAHSGNVIGTNIGAGHVAGSGIVGPNGGLLTNRDATRTFFDTLTTAPATTVFGIFETSDFEFLLAALRQNSLLKVLAEPNLVALNGHQASFLAGGQFPVPVTQTGTGGGAPAVTVQFQPFGVRLNFTPYIEDGDVIRLAVHPDVSTVDFALGTVLVPGGTPVPGLDEREAQTTVELRQGQTLAIAGLLQLSLDGQTTRIPGLGDLPILGPFFSNTTNTRTEKELVVLVTPYLIEPANASQASPTPGDEVKEPNDLEFYLLNRIEGRTGRDARSTTDYDDPFHLLHHVMRLEDQCVQGPHGFDD